MKTQLNLNFLENATEMLRAMAHPIRLSIVELLERRGALTVTEIYETLELEQALTSHHLRIMRDRGILKARRAGKNTFYELRIPEVGHVINLMVSIQPGNDARLVA